MNQINFEQQNQMFEKQAEWNSAKSQKERLQEAGLNPALMSEYRDWETDRKSTRLNSSHITRSRMPSSA